MIFPFKRALRDAKPGLPRAPGARKRIPAGVVRLFGGSEGAIGLMFAVCGSLMIGAMCGALDLIHYQMSQARLQMAIDVTALSAGVNAAHFDATKPADKAQWKEDLFAYLNANMPSGSLDIDLPGTNVVADITGSPLTGQTITISASGTQNLLAPIFLANGGQGGSDSGSSGGTDGSDNSVATVSAANAVTRIAASTLELVMVLDNTGSMGSYASSDKSQGTKIQGLRSAAQTFVNSIIGQTTGDSYIGLVPFTTVVNLKGSLLTSGSWFSPKFEYNDANVSIAPSSVAGSGWGGCVVEPRDGPRGSGNLKAEAYSPASSPGFTPFYYNVPPSTGFSINTFNKTTNKQGQTVCTAVSTTTVPGVPLSYQTNGSASYCGGDGATITDWWGQPQTDKPAMTTYDQNGLVNSKGVSVGPCSIQPVQFLTQDKSALTNAITNMQANGSTIIPTGLLWGWRMLRSDWSTNGSKKSASGGASTNNGWVSTDPNLPLPETTSNLQRVVVVLTDGENDPGGATGVMPNPSFNGLSGVADSSLRVPSVTRPGGGTLADGQMTSVTDINLYQLAVCQKMKDEGILIYAITFGSVGATAEKVMRGCASGSGYYFNAPSNDELKQIFGTIAGNLGSIRLTQ
jgi:Flp pilus assembly protein TadG